MCSYNNYVYYTRFITSTTALKSRLMTSLFRMSSSSSASFPLLCVIDVSYDTPSFNSDLRQRSYSYAKIFISAPSPRDLNEVTPSGGRRARKP